MTRSLGLAALCLVAACTAAREPAAAVPDPNASPGVMDLVVGTWDWARGDSTCLGNRHQISFSADGTEMRLTHDVPLDSTTNDRVTRYRILDSGAGVHPDLPFVIRAAMEGEDRRTEAGELVIWDLILATPNRYHWHRTDWPNLGVTNAIVRCDGRRPLEHWQAPDEVQRPATPVS